MKIKPRHYPHPVLAYFSNDFIDAKFTANIEAEDDASNKKINFTIDYKLTDNNLKKLVEKEKEAEYALHLECNSTRFRKLLTSNQPSFTAKIDNEKISGNLEANPLIIATKDLIDYQSSSFHEDYGGLGFKIKKGDILAVAEEISIDIDNDIDALKEMSSIFSVQPNESDNAPPLDIESLGSDKIIVQLSKENFERYRLLKQNQNLHTTLASMLIIPTLVSLLEAIKNEIEEGTFNFDHYNNFRWFRVLARRLEQIDIDLAETKSFSDSAIEVALKVIGDPLTNSLEMLEQYEG